MSIKYKMIQRADYINAAENKKTGYYPLVVRKQTVGIDRLAYKVAQGKPIRTIEVESIIRTLLSCIEDELLDGNSVCLEGFGTFSLTAECRPTDDPDKIRAESIKVKRVTFVASSPLRNHMTTAVFERD